MVAAMAWLPAKVLGEYPAVLGSAMIVSVLFKVLGIDLGVREYAA